jgi:hypothetical protein
LRITGSSSVSRIPGTPFWPEFSARQFRVVYLTGEPLTTGLFVAPRRSAFGGSVTTTFNWSNMRLRADLTSACWSGNANE